MPRSDGAKMSPMIASAIGNRAPAPRPWMPRATISHSIDWREARQHGADQEDADAEQEDRSSAVQVGELAVDRPADRRGQQVGGERPRVEVVALEVGDDPRQGGPDDGLVEGGKEDADHDREEDAQSDRCGNWTGAMSPKVGTAWAWLADTRTSEALLGVAAGPDPGGWGRRGVDEPRAVSHMLGKTFRTAWM